MNAAFHRKLKLKGSESIGLVNNPDHVGHKLLPLPAQSTFSKSPSSKDHILFWFVKNRAELDAGIHKALSYLGNNNIIWIGYPKGTSGIKSDLNRDILHALIMAHPDLAYLGFVSFDDTWSTFCFRRKTMHDEKKQTKRTIREISKFADAKSKTIKVPEDLQKAFTQNKIARSIFDSLAFSHRREYVEWIVSAKKNETRMNRIQGTIEKLLAGKKNPTTRS